MQKISLSHSLGLSQDNWQSCHGVHPYSTPSPVHTLNAATLYACTPGPTHPHMACFSTCIVVRLRTRSWYSHLTSSIGVMSVVPVSVTPYVASPCAAPSRMGTKLSNLKSCRSRNVPFKSPQTVTYIFWARRNGLLSAVFSDLYMC